VRAKKPFIALNCSAIPADLLESELFGYQKGAFSGATRDKRGLIEEAHEGTLFLDEIGEMPLPLQAKLLRVLETHKLARVGSTELLDIDFRIIAATNANPQEEIAAGRFRADLYYRLEGFTIVLPALRDRQEDIEILARYFLNTFAAKYKKNVAHMSQEFIEALKQRRWKGNVRELRNSIERAVVLCSGTTLTPDLLSPELDDLHFQGHLPHAAYTPYGQPILGAPAYPVSPLSYSPPPAVSHISSYAAPQYPAAHRFTQNNASAIATPYTIEHHAAHSTSPSNEQQQTQLPALQPEPAQESYPQFSLRRAEDERARQEIIAALQASGGHREKTAKLLGISPATLYRKLQKYGIH
ncbi:MAG: sigma-54 dependent transcriptional regulator, partial [Bacteroidota bacterium]|nr:sigma-54 dependent transcriptional regulator [Candidatus Kapabacteria bacterium]MDW8220996.1 sigma-54 dependent transcriptional regulator [Bacteroidota bacterium]